MKIRVVLLQFLTLLSCFAAGCDKRVNDSEQVSPEEKIVIKFSHVVSENTPKGLAAQRFATLVKERTMGRVEVQVFPNSTLYSDGDEIEALKSGTVQMIAPATSKLSRLSPQWQIFDLPFALNDEAEVHREMDGPTGEKLLSSLSASNIQGLAFWDNGFKQMTNGKRPLINPEDFGGLTFRVMINSQVLKRQFEELGAYPVEIQFNDLYHALETNLADGQENTLSNICSKKLYRVQPYLTISNHGYMGYVVMTNAKFWSSLPDDVRLTLESTLHEVTEWERQISAEKNRESMEEVVSYGKVQIHQLTEAERNKWFEALHPLHMEFRDITGE